MLCISLRLVGINNCFLWCLSKLKMSSQKRVYGNERILIPWDSYEVCWTGHFYTTGVITNDVLRIRKAIEFKSL